MKASLFLGSLALLGAGLLGLSACTTESFCFADCDGPPNGTSGFGGTEAGPDVIIGGNGGSGGTLNPDASGGTGGCVPTNAGVEICDGVDNDCNGRIDDGVDLTSPRSCGACGNDCTNPDAGLIGPNVESPACENGVCRFNKCKPDFYDNDGDPTNGCEYHCPYNRDGTNTTDPGGVSGCGIDDDCDLGKPSGGIDEEIFRISRVCRRDGVMGDGSRIRPVCSGNNRNFQAFPPKF